MKTSSGNDAQARMMGGGGGGIAVAATSPSATGFSCSGLTSGAYVGQLVVLGGVYGLITANTATSVTIDRWYTPGSDGGAAASYPAAGTAVIVPGNSPSRFMALSTDSTAPSASDTTLPSEITTSGGGLIRQLAVYAHTTGVAGYTLTGTFTANGSDAGAGFPRTVAKMGIFGGMVPGSGAIVFETLLSSSATFNASGDQLTLTQSVTN